MADAAWKRTERRIARLFGTTRVGPTGKLGPDIIGDKVAIQVKHRQKLPKWMQAAWDTIFRQAHEMGKLGLMVLHQHGDRDDLVILSLKDFLNWFGPRIVSENGGPRGSSHEGDQDG